MADGAQRAAARLLFELAEQPSARPLLVRTLHMHPPAHGEQRHQHAAAPQAAQHPAAPPPGALRQPRPPAPPSTSAARLGQQLPILQAPARLQVLDDGPQAEAEQAAAQCGGRGGDGSSTSAAANAAEQQQQQQRQRGWARRVRGLALRVADATQPSGDAPGDATWGERTANVLTSLPFLALGWHMQRRRLTAEGRSHARSLLAVGAAATLYHATSGAARRVARKIDYWTIAWSSTQLVKSVYADSPGVRRAASLSLLAVPFRPFAVSCANAALMQTEFARQAARHKAVRRDLARHYAAAALGVGAFFFEDLVMDSGWGGYVHSAWHCLAVYSVATLDGLLSHRERQQLQAQLARGGGAAAAGCRTPAGLGGKPLRRPVHSSASSLPSYGSGFGYGKAAGGSPAGSSPAGWSPGLLSPPPGCASPLGD